ncbi:endonuclease [Aestuariibaculum lutulentum]|uniref:Endonuclease n=1 Tax=Aestuariibaculum lutulentum TaxID=2920935 RepID=A0ABS9RDT2_9FLAO|nr:endonuclease [Aestuariibaculum lutulentum]MCH4551100.1 endonuclease [Aestuariibaculum lutulentum]
MEKIVLFCLAVLSINMSLAQIVINELDSDTSGIDDLEFLELKSDTSNFSLDGYVVVFFNGSDSGMNSSYLALDLDGYTTDVNGLLLIGSVNVSPIPQYIIPANTIQNGADAVAIYQADETDFPVMTLATIENLVDVLIYGTADADDVDLIDIFNDHPDFTNIQQIDEGGGGETGSIQRNNDGTYTVGIPTPRQLNDGTGIILNGISISTTQNQYAEGDFFDITFTTEQNVASDLNFSFSLNNDTFNTSDFTGNTSLTIPAGQNSVSTTITLVDDNEDEGDEVLKISMGNLSDDYLKQNDKVEIRVVDNDFQMAGFGTPLNPTYGLVSSSQPEDYYNSLEGLSGLVLKQAIQDIVANPSVVRAQTYADIIDILKEADQNPDNSNQVWLVYSETGRAKLDFQTTSSNVGKWNREHVYPRSRGGFNSIDLDEIADGKDVFWTTTADSLRHGNSDAYALRAVDGVENSIRNNQNYGTSEYAGPTGTSGSFYGDVARSIFYMVTRYNGLDVVNGYPGDDPDGFIGDLATLLEWHRNDPPDDFEMNRNNVIYTWQNNRNPYIDNPELVEYLWGNKIGETYSEALSVDNFNGLQMLFYPNPTHNALHIKGVTNEISINVLSVEGKLIDSFIINNDRTINLNLLTGVYVLKCISGNQVISRRIVVK